MCPPLNSDRLNNIFIKYVMVYGLEVLGFLLLASSTMLNTRRLYSVGREVSQAVKKLLNASKKIMNENLNCTFWEVILWVSKPVWKDFLLFPPTKFQ